MSHHEIPAPSGETRTESDTFGPIKVSASAYYGAQTARSMYHFNIGLPTGKLHLISNFFPSQLNFNVGICRSDAITCS